MDTTTAAKAARVSVETVRTWCRMGAVKATKAAGQWTIEVSSLARRIRIEAPTVHVWVIRHPKRVGDLSGRGGKWGYRLDMGSPRGEFDTQERAELAAAREARAKARRMRQPTKKLTEKEIIMASEDQPTQPTPKKLPPEQRGWSKAGREMGLGPGRLPGDRGVCFFCGVQLQADGECGDCGSQDH